MVHNSTFFLAVNPARRNDTAWQKTLGLNDWYEAGPDTPYPLGNLQMLGKLQAPMVKAARSWAPMWALKMVTDRSLDIYLTTEDLPRPDNRVTVDGDKIMISWTPNNLTPHHELVKRVSRAVRKAGYPIVLTERMGIATNSHMCGTAVAGTDPSASVLDPNCRSHDVSNLFIVDSSFFPSSAALNPALTIAANALRVAPTIAGSTGSSRSDRPSESDASSGDTPSRPAGRGTGVSFEGFGAGGTVRRANEEDHHAHQQNPAWKDELCPLLVGGRYQKNQSDQVSQV